MTTSYKFAPVGNVSVMFLRSSAGVETTTDIGIIDGPDSYLREGVRFSPTFQVIRISDKAVLFTGVYSDCRKFAKNLALALV